MSKRVYLGYGLFTHTQSQEMCEKLATIANRIDDKRTLELLKEFVDSMQFDNMIELAEKEYARNEIYTLSDAEIDALNSIAM